MKLPRRRTNADGRSCAGPLAHHERRRDAERPELLLQFRDPIARRLQRVATVR